MEKERGNKKMKKIKNRISRFNPFFLFATELGTPYTVQSVVQHDIVQPIATNDQLST